MNLTMDQILQKGIAAHEKGELKKMIEKVNS